MSGQTAKYGRLLTIALGGFFALSKPRKGLTVNTDLSGLFDEEGNANVNNRKGAGNHSLADARKWSA